MKKHSHLVYLGAAAAALIVVASGAAEAGFPVDRALSVLTGWPWNGLWAMTLGVIIWTVSAARWGRRRGRHHQNMAVDSLDEAFCFARDALAVRERGGRRRHVGRVSGLPPVDPDGLWRSQALTPLAALVYTASSHGNGEGLPWLTQMIGRLCENGGDSAWRDAESAIAEVDTALLRWIGRIAAMDRRQRNSVAVVMREALAPYAAVRR